MYCVLYSECPLREVTIHFINNYEDKGFGGILTLHSLDRALYTKPTITSVTLHNGNNYQWAPPAPDV